MLASHPVVQARNLIKTFKGRRAVDDLTLTVGAGERIGLLGPNGAGKTTTLLMLLGAIAPDSGDIEITGLRLPRHRSKAMTRVGFVAGYLPLPENLTYARASNSSPVSPACAGRTPTSTPRRRRSVSPSC